MIEVTTENFDKKVLESKKPVLVDFWAEWCGPCKMLAPILEKVSKEFNKKIAFAKMNVEFAPEVGQRFGIQGIPCLILFKNGEEEGRITGLHQEPELRKKIKEML